MANIDTYLQAIMAAIYGRDVRQSIHDAIQAINDDVDGFVRGELDTTLTSTTLPAQGKAVGDAVNGLKNTLEREDDGLSNNINILFDALDGNVQYVESSSKTAGYRWNLSSAGVLTMPATEGYSAFKKITGLKAGTYNYDAVYDAFSVIENASTGELTKLSAISGVNSTLATGRSVNITYDFNIYLTRSETGNWPNYQTMLCTGPLPSSYVYGIYDGLLNDQVLTAEKTYISSSNYATLLPDFDTAANNRIYVLIFGNGSTTIPAHYPFSAYKDTVNTLITFGGTASISKSQIIISDNFVVYRRRASETTWNDWLLLTSKDEIEIITNKIESIIEYDDGLSSNINILFDALDGNVQYVESSSKTAGYRWNLSSAGVLTMPATEGYSAFKKITGLKAGTYNYDAVYDAFSVIENASTGELTKLSAISGVNSTLATGRSVNITYDFNIYLTRSETGNWPNYQTMLCTGPLPSSYVYGIYDGLLEELPKKIIVDINGSGDFTTLKAGLEEAIKHAGTTVYVLPGVYNLITEFGQEYFANLGTSDERAGLQLGNDMHVIFSSAAKVSCHYTGENPNVDHYFSPFNSKNSSFILENATIDASRVRYCVHDEHNRSSNRYRSVYKNCNMKLDNSLSTVWNNPQCIGGGLGTNGEIIIEDSYFYGEGATRDKGIVSYHNCSEFGSKSRIIVKGCYFDGENATVRFGYYGASEEITDCMVCGNSFSVEPLVRAENTSATIINMRMYDYNNEIRTA